MYRLRNLLGHEEKSETDHRLVYNVPDDPYKQFYLTWVDDTNAFRWREITGVSTGNVRSLAVREQLCSLPHWVGDRDWLVKPLLYWQTLPRFS